VPQQTFGGGPQTSAPPAAAPPAPGGSGGGLRWWVWLTIALVLAALAGAAVALFVLRRPHTR
jgi:hypothetical protein